MLSFTILSIIILNVDLLCVIILDVIVLSVFILSVIIKGSFTLARFLGRFRTKLAHLVMKTKFFCNKMC
jgi:hypothetical protein